MSRAFILLAAITASSLFSGPSQANGDGFAGKCAITFFADSDTKYTKKGQWLAMGNGTFKMFATCNSKANEVAVSGGYHWDNPQNQAGQLQKWLVVGSTFYQSDMPQAYADGWQCVLQNKDDPSATTAPSGLWCAVNCCPK